jgi:hypothetical protein
MDHGTGVDLWWQDWEDGSVTLAEAYDSLNGDRHGFEWWLFADGTASQERHWLHGELHGIEREWNDGGGLRRGYPRYFVHGERVTKRQYVATCAKDASLPPFRAEDNVRRHTLPPAGPSSRPL